MGVIFGDTGIGGQGEEDDEGTTDFEDELYFRPRDKKIDISKHIRGMVHLEITINATCNPSCKGLCHSCGKNLNTGNCNCSKQQAKKGFGLLTILKEDIQRRIRGLRESTNLYFLFKLNHHPVLSTIYIS